MRKASTILALGLAAPALSALPVLTAPAASAHPVAPEVRNRLLSGVAEGLLGSPAAARGSAVARRAWQAAGGRSATRPSGPPSSAPAARPAVLAAATGVAPFDLVGVTWRAQQRAGDFTVVVRTRSAHGWSGWTALEAGDTPPPAEAAGVRDGTEPLWVGRADGYQVRVDLHSGRLPADLRIALVDPGSSAADASAGRGAPAAASASAAVAAPPVNSRAAWGADERLRSAAPRYTGTVKAGFVHHTAGKNNYTAAQVPQIIRGVYAFHTRSNHWSDIGYNFLVDRFGRLWEGRAGGITNDVLGAHTGGFNTDSFAVSAIGDYGKTAAPPVMVDSIARLLAWRLSLAFRNPMGTTTLVSEGGGTSRYRAGTAVGFNVISGHRDAGNTECPGQFLYDQLGTIRSLATQYMGPGLVDPATSTDQPAYGGPPLTVTAATMQQQSWTFEVRDHWDGRLLSTQSGTAAPGQPVAASWDLRDQAGVAVRPGPFDLTLFSSGATDGARTWTHQVTVVPPAVTPPPAPRAALPPASGFVPLDPARVYDSTDGRLPMGPGERLDLPVAGRGGVPSGGVGAVALTVTASRPSASTYLSVWPAGASKPTASTLNVSAGGTKAALTMTALGGNGLVSLYNNTGTTEVAVDVVGYYPSARAADGTVTGQTLHAVSPFRLFDSRKDPAGPLAKGSGRTIAMPGLSGIAPEQMGGVVLNVTATQGTGTGTVTVHRAGSGLGAGTSLSYVRGVSVANRAVTALSQGGRLRIDSRGAAAHVVLDVVGWYAPTSVAGGKAFQAVSPRRVLDTRTGLGAKRARVAANRTIALTVRGKGGALPANASAVVMNLTATDASASTYLTAWPAGVPRPTASDLNVLRGRTTANLVVVAIGRKGRVNLYNRSGSTHLVGDVVGFYR
ncbi:MAG: hypothetical protein QOI54_1421 [Actinomycetota bacterium]|nr:hypothetical protein [Actinomycetota bacterium]